MKRLCVFFMAMFIILCAKSQDVSVLMQTPPSATQGQEFEISLTINKSDVSGFARLQLDMPAGFTVKASQTQGSTFSFKDNKIRFLWMSLPADRTLKVSCLATADNTVSGSVNIEGSFSYVLNNETQRYSIPVQSIRFGGAAVASYDNSAQIEAERLEKERQERLAKEKVEHEKAAREKAEREAQAEAERIALAYANSATEEEEEEEEVYTAEVKTVSYETSSTEEEVVEITPPKKVEPVYVEPAKPTYSTTTTTTTPPATTPKSTTASTSSSSYSTSTSKSGVEYKVQIGAFKNTPDPNYFKKIENNISEFRVNKSSDSDGFVRYFIGSFNSFTEVSNFHQRVEQLGYTSFIVAHKDGRKITIREAKAISSN